MAHRASNHTHAHLPALTACAKLAHLRINDSDRLDFSVIAHLPVTAIEVRFAPDEQTAKATPHALGKAGQASDP